MCNPSRVNRQRRRRVKCAVEASWVIKKLWKQQQIFARLFAHGMRDSDTFMYIHWDFLHIYKAFYGCSCILYADAGYTEKFAKRHLLARISGTLYTRHILLWGSYRYDSRTIPSLFLSARTSIYISIYTIERILSYEQNSQERISRKKVSQPPDAKLISTVLILYLLRSQEK